ncbi:alpha/beta hydrolase [Kineococcus vitellinus]|uniref:alpha/beta fold hydrolase n=1 Tax=Kineococcus vitellinus TaxID=2696565 RepID=UPI00141226AB
MDGFTTRSVEVAEGVHLRVDLSHEPSAPDRPTTAVVLLHGFPQTRHMWRHVAPLLADEHFVLCPDLRGYGASGKPAASTPDVYAKRTMAADVIALADALGVQRFVVVGHDRGAHVAFRAALDHPGRVSHLAGLDVLPTVETWDVLHGAQAAVAFHLYLMAQPPGLPEAMIRGSADAFFGHFLDAWTRDPAAIPAPVREHYLRASREAIDSIVADYRALAGIDVEHDLASRAGGERLRMPVTVLQQDWGAQLGFDAAALWRSWAPDLQHVTTAAGHFMAEEAPGEVVEVIRALARRSGRW